MPNLLINIWDYANKPNCPICKQYQKWCISAAKEKWKDSYIEFDFVIGCLKKQNKNWFDFGEISLANRNQIYVVISKKKKEYKKHFCM